MGGKVVSRSESRDSMDVNVAYLKPQSKNLKERGTIFVMETCDRQLVLLNFVEVTPR
jgi:hypothetical protein